jgi:hypothetical protein
MHAWATSIGKPTAASPVAYAIRSVTATRAPMVATAPSSSTVGSSQRGR